MSFTSGSESSKPPASLPPSTMVIGRGGTERTIPVKVSRVSLHQFYSPVNPFPGERLPSGRQTDGLDDPRDRGQVRSKG